MAAPTIVKSQVTPTGTLSDLPYLFKSGFGLTKQLWTGPTQDFQWVTSATNSDEFYLTLIGGGDPNLSINSNAIQRIELWGTGIIPVLDATDILPIPSDYGNVAADFRIENLGVSTGHLYNLSGLVTFTSPTSENVRIRVYDANSDTVILADATLNTQASLQRTINLSFIAYDGITNVDIRFTPNTANSSLSGLSLTQDTNTYDGMRFRLGTPGSLERFGYGYGDNDTLGFNTVYARMFDNTKPPNGSMRLLYDVSTSGDGSPYEDCLHQFWFGSTSAASIPNPYRYVLDPRDPRKAQNILIDMQGTAPTSEKNSLIRGNSYIPVLGTGASVIFYRCTNPSGLSTTTRWDITANANNRTNYTVGSGEDYDTLAEAVTAQTGNDNIALQLMDGHEESILSTITITDDNWKIYWNGVGTKPVLRSVIGQEDAVVPLAIDRVNGFVLDGVTFRPSAILVGGDSTDDDASVSCINVTKSKLVGIFNSNMRAFGDTNIEQYNNPTPGSNQIDGSNDTYNGFVGLSNFWNASNSDTEQRTQYMDGIVIQNCWNDGHDSYFLSETSANMFYENTFVIGCSFGNSDNESGIRQTSPCTSYHLLFNGIMEARKDAIRTTKGGYNTLYANRWDGAYRHGATSPNVHDTVHNIIRSNYVVRTLPASKLACFNMADGSYNVMIANNVCFISAADSPGFTFFNGITASSAYDFESEPYRGATISRNVKMLANTAIATPAMTGSRCFGPSANNPANFGHVCRFNMISKENTNTNGLYSNMTNIDFGSNATTQDWGISSLGIPTLGISESSGTPSNLYEDIWGNVRGATSYYGAAIAAPNDSGTPVVNFGDLGVFDEFGLELTENATFGLGTLFQQASTFVDQEFSFVNNGPGTLEFVTVTISGDFGISVGVAAGITVAEGESVGFTTFLDLGITGSKASTVNITTTNPLDPSFHFNLSGTVNAPDTGSSTRILSVTLLDGTVLGNGSSLSLGDYLKNSQGRVTIKITNTGTLSVTGIQFSLGGELSTAGSFPLSLAKNASAVVVIDLNTSSVALLRTGTINITSNADEPSYQSTMTYSVSEIDQNQNAPMAAKAAWGKTTAKANRPVYLNPHQKQSAVLTPRGWEVRSEGNGNPNATEVVVAGDFGYLDPDTNEIPNIYLLNGKTPLVTGTVGQPIRPTNLEMVDTEKVLGTDRVTYEVASDFPLPDGLVLTKKSTQGMIELFEISGTPTEAGSGVIRIVFTDSYVPDNESEPNTIEIDINYNIAS